MTAGPVPAAYPDGIGHLVVAMTWVFYPDKAGARALLDQYALTPRR